MFFINTRPTDRAEALSSALFAHDVKVIDLPLLELKSFPLSSHLIDLFDELFHVNIVVVVSPTAAEIGMAYLQQQHINLKSLSHLRWIAVGKKTAEYLNKYGIDSFVPSVETSEGMLQLPILNQLHIGSKVAFWRGEGGRQFMMEQLQQRGMKVLNFVLYERNCPLQSINEIHKIALILQQEPFYIMLLSSEASWLNWLKLIQFNSSLLNRGQYWVLGDRLFQLLHDYKKQNSFDFQIIKLANLKTELILQHIAHLQGKL